MSKVLTNKEIFEIIESKKGVDNLKSITLQGWVKTNRDNGSVGFIELNDGTCFKSIQLVYTVDCENHDIISSFKTGEAVEIVGDVILTPENKQPFEVKVLTGKLVGNVSLDYPLQKKRCTMEFLRDIAHVRVRSNTFQAVYRVRNVMTMAIHEFFQKENFIYVHTPIITANDAEGAGETFSVVTDLKKPDSFYGKNVSLTVSGQLHVEPFALAFKKVYTFGPAFRAEHSNTTRHASEFWMIEPEIAFCDLNGDMDVIERCIKYCLNVALTRCKDELEFFNKFIDTTLIERLKHVANSEFKRLPYTQGVEILKKAVKDGVKFDNPNIEWGMDFQSEHERYLTEKVVGGPVFITDYPKDIKAFYMKLNPDGKTVAACDLLVPYVGELVGGSQREDNYDILKEKMEKAGNIKGLEWYLETRKFGGCPHAGFGIGFDRLLMYVTGINNIRDVQPYPRTCNTIKY